MANMDCLSICLCWFGWFVYIDLCACYFVPLFQQGNEFQNAVFNETIQVVEPDEGLDGET